MHQIIQVALISKILTTVKCQFMAPPMGGMHFPQMPQLPQMPGGPLGAMSMPGMPSPMSMPGMPPPPMAMPGMPMPMPMPMPFMNAQRMPTVVMPYYSKQQDKKHKNKKNNKKKDRKIRKKKRKYIPISSSSSDVSDSDDDTDSSDDSSCGDFAFRSGKRRGLRSRSRRGKHRRQVLTPIISYVTNDGYVVYQKKIKKNNAKDWLEMGNVTPNKLNGDKISSSEEVLRKVIRKKMNKMREKKDFLSN